MGTLIVNREQLAANNYANEPTFTFYSSLVLFVLLLYEKCLNVLTAHSKYGGCEGLLTADNDPFVKCYT